MLKILIFVIAIFFASPLYAFDFSGIIKSYIDGQNAGRQRALEEQQLYLQQLEAEKTKQEIEYLKSLNKKQEEAHKEKELSNSVFAHINRLHDGQYKLNAYKFAADITNEPDPKIRIISYEEILKILKERLQKQDSLEDFEKNVKPHVMKVHPDFEDIILGPKTDYWAWAEKQEPHLKNAALNSPKPEDIIWAISEYKKYKRK